MSKVLVFKITDRFILKNKFNPLESMVYKQNFYKLIMEFHTVSWLTEQSIPHKCLTNHFQFSFSSSEITKLKQNPSEFFPSPQVMKTWEVNVTQPVVDTFSLCSHTSRNPRFNHFSFLKPKMNYYLPLKAFPNL